MAVLTPRERMRRAAVELVEALADALGVPSDAAELAPRAPAAQAKKVAPTELDRARARAVLERKGRI